MPEPDYNDLFFDNTPDELEVLKNKLKEVNDKFERMKYMLAKVDPSYVKWIEYNFGPICYEHGETK